PRASANHHHSHSFPTRRSSDLQVQKYEKGVNRVGAGRLTKIAEVLGIDVGAFFAGKEMLDGAQSKESGASSPLKLLTVSGAFRRSEEHTSELQSHLNIVCRLLL